MTLHAVPKPAKPIRGTVAAKRYMDLVAQVSCVCCNRYGVQVHHCIHGRFSQGRASDFDTIPLCKPHHDELHCMPKWWQAKYGQDTDYIGPTRAAVEQIRLRTIGGRE
jgi:hypothetical protein